MQSRRKFLSRMGLSVLGTGASLSGLAGLHEGINRQQSARGVRPNADKLGVALVGLGSYATGQLAPALQETEHCYLAGIVTGSPSKIPVWQEKYQIPDENVYNYDNFDKIADNPAIDIVYVVLPNALHAEYTIRAATAGKHVICEKPMAMNPGECDAMMSACRRAGKMLSIGYRLHFEPYNREMMRLGQQEVYGPVQKMNAAFGFTIGDPTQWRLKKSMAGGGPLVDVGIYCIQGFCYTTGLEPTAVRAWEGMKPANGKFDEVEASVAWQFEMPGGVLADGKASYTENICHLAADAENGSFRLSPAFYYSGLKGTTSHGEMLFPQVVQQAGQMDDFTLAIRDNRPTAVSGEMGKRDVRYIAAIYEAMSTGATIKL